jgi:hypothetical protein
MLKTKNILVRSIHHILPRRLHLLLLMFLLPAFLIVPRGVYGSEPTDVSVPEPYALDILGNDVLTIYIRPYLDHVYVRCEPLDRGNPSQFSVQTDYTDDYFGKVTAVWVQPEASGMYNVTVTFESNATCTYVIGAYTRNFEFYTEYYGKNIKTYGYFVEFRDPVNLLSGNWTISILLNSHSLSPNLFSVELPTPVNSALLLTATGLIAYFNAFLLFDTYFKNKKETVSNKRWILVAVLIVISAFVIYEFYNFMTFTLRGGI